MRNIAAHEWPCLHAWSRRLGRCPECSRRHHCGEEMLLPIVNSPRVGTCACGT